MKYSVPWTNGLLQPIYVPPELGEVKRLFSEGKFEPGIDQLVRLAQLGSNSAAATLGYLCLLSEETDGRDIVSGLRLCRAAALKGDGYAQYVTAWHEYELGRMRSFIKWLNRSARQRFMPAWGDLALLMVSERKPSDSRSALAKRAFLFAIRRGHLASILVFLGRSLVGKFGWRYRVFAGIAFPIAILIVGFAIRVRPFSCAVLSYPVGKKGILKRR